MVGTSKILTVSYGTFSCTLEGFDDSFNTMKAIAEYFRGLASEDRYFGAEPPTPDAEMLARIAEREIERRVDAHMDGTGIVLRAAALTNQSPTKPAVDSGSDTGSDAVSPQAVNAPDGTADRLVAQAAAEAKAKADAEAQAEAEALAEAQAQAQAKAQAEAEALAAEAEARAAAEAKAAAEAQEQADAQAREAAAREAEREAAEREAERKAEQAAAEEEAKAAQESAWETADLGEGAAPEEAPVAEPAPLPAHPDANSVAAKLQRIRAVVGRADAEKVQTHEDEAQNDAFLPEEHRPALSDFDAPAARDDFDDLSDDQPEIRAFDDTADEGDNMIARVMAGQSQEAAPAPQSTENKDQNTADASTQTSQDETQPQARIRSVEAAPAAPATPDLGLLDGADELDAYFEDSDFDAGEDLSFDDDLSEDLEAIEAEVREDTTFAAPASEVPASEVPASEVIERETERGNTPVASGAQHEDPALADPDVDRLMSETDAQMQEPASSRRRDAIAQLKAAVAAKEAARQIGEPDDDGQDMENAFRNDLSEAVQPDEAANRPLPRQVKRPETRTERPRPAPLKLVQAQRVDVQPEGSNRADGPVVPRRVATARAEEPKSAASGSFAEFADNMGATNLPDLLEAAAAYTAFVEGAEEFSRPQLLRRVRAVTSDDFNREDGLRSFNDLLRAGRITKVSNGRFQVADDSRFNPELRAG